MYASRLLCPHALPCPDRHRQRRPGGIKAGGEAFAPGAPRPPRGTCSRVGAGRGVAPASPGPAPQEGPEAAFR